MKPLKNKMLLMDTLLEVLDVEERKIHESLPPGFSPADLQSIDDFSKNPINEEEKFLGAPVTDWPEPELKSYMDRIAAGTKGKDDPTEKYKYPYIHKSNIIDDATGKVVDPDVLRKLIIARPDKILKQNAKMQHSGGDLKFFDISLPALRGIIVDELTGDFKIVNTCPGAGPCKVYCYARKGGYVQWKRASLLQTRVLNFLLNDWAGFKAKVKSEIESVSKKAGKNFVKTAGNKYKVVIRWHDSGDFMAEKYLNIAFDIARETPDVLHYAYTKRVGMVGAATKPDNFVFNFSQGAAAPEEGQIDTKKDKHSVVVPRQFFSDYLHKDKETEKWVFNSPQALDIFKDKMSLKYSIDKDTILTYDELMKTPYESDRVKKLNIIVPAGSGDDAASRSDVQGTYLLIH